MDPRSRVWIWNIENTGRQIVDDGSKRLEDLISETTLTNESITEDGSENIRLSDPTVRRNITQAALHALLSDDLDQDGKLEQCRIVEICQFLDQEESSIYRHAHATMQEGIDTLMANLGIRISVQSFLTFLKKFPEAVQNPFRALQIPENAFRPQIQFASAWNLGAHAVYLWFMLSRFSTPGSTHPTIIQWVSVLETWYLSINLSRMPEKDAYERAAQYLYDWKDHLVAFEHLMRKNLQSIIGSLNLPSNNDMVSKFWHVACAATAIQIYRAGRQINVEQEVELLVVYNAAYALKNKAFRHADTWERNRKDDCTWMEVVAQLM